MEKTITRRKLNNTPTHLSHLHPVLARIYSTRGVSARAELEKSIHTLIPYGVLMDIDKAATLLAIAIEEQQRILIVGDFDADGATSTALCVSALRAFGLQHVHYLVPNRFEYGYGLTPEIVEVAAEWNPDLLVTVDNGISSVEGVAAANAKGIKVVVTDHHLPGEELPAAAAIVNPNQFDDAFPSKNLAGVGVIFYVMLALRRHLSEKGWFAAQQLPEPNMGQFLDLVALGTVADVVPLDKNNRVLVHQGLGRIRAGKCRPGISALINIAKRNPAKMVATDLGFAVAPRLNAAGRLDDMSLGIECLLTQDPEKARDMAEQLNALNLERRAIEAEMQQSANKILERLTLGQSEDLPIALALYDATWHQGVIGILAGRIKEQIYRPVIAFAKVSDTEIKGSARSVPGLHIRDALDAIAKQHPTLIQKFGGHAMAAGLSLELKHLEEFTTAWQIEVAKHLQKDTLCSEVLSDGELMADEMTLDLAELLRDAGPWGQGFPAPIFDGKFKIIQQRIVGRNHLKLTLQAEGGSGYLDAIAFNIKEDEWPNHHCETIEIAYRLDINEYQGRCKLQLIVEHLTAVAVDLD